MYLLGGLFFLIFKIVQRVLLLCSYLKDNSFFPTGKSPFTSLKFAHLPTRKYSTNGRHPQHQFFSATPPTKSSSPPVNNNFEVIT